MNYLLPVTQFASVIFFDSSDEEETVVEKIDQYAERTVPNMHSQQFKIHFRMEPETFEDLLGKASLLLLRNNLNVSGVGHPRIPLEKEIMITIWCLGNLESFRSVSDRFGVTKSTCWDVLYRTSRFMLKINESYRIIKWPDQERQRAISNNFNSHNFTGIIGCIDGSHIKIVAPKIHKNSYVNRKGYHSVLLQAVCDHKKLFIDVYAGEVGSLHDYTLYRRSPLYNRIQHRQIIFHEDNYLLGDLAYKLSTTLIVGFKNNGHLTPQQMRFNIILSKKRAIIENAYALLKGRFRRLKFMETIRLDLVSLLIVTACILHNICIFNGDIPNDIMNVEQEVLEEIVNRPNNELDIMEEAVALQATIKRNNIVLALNIVQHNL